MPRVEKLLIAAADYDRIVAHAKEGLPTVRSKHTRDIRNGK